MRSPRHTNTWDESIRCSSAPVPISKLVKGLLAGAALAASGSAFAVPIDAGLTVTGDADLFQTLSDGNVNQTGAVRSIIGGVTTSAGFTTTPGVQDGINDATTVGPVPNPLGGGLTDLGDGAGYNTNLTSLFAAGQLAPVVDGYDFAVDLGINLTNTTATNIYTATMKLDFSRSADAGGADSFAEVELLLTTELNAGGVVIVPGSTSDVFSDTLLGDSLNGVPQGTFGALIADAGILFFNVILNPGDIVDVQARDKWSGSVFLNPGSSDVLSTMDLTLDALSCITQTGAACGQGPGPGPDPIPEPGILALFGLGLAGLAVTRRRRQP